MKIVAVDPGDRWVGIVRLYINGAECLATARVLDRVEYDTLSHVAARVFAYRPETIVVESYQARAVGHQRFSAGSTPRLIGALEYVAEQKGVRFAEVAPGNPDQELPYLPLWPMLTHWRAYRSGEREWRHADAAWRVLQRYLLRFEEPQARRLAACTFEKLRVDAREVRRMQKRKLQMPDIRWRLT